jgi:hypothetical protein
MRSYDHRNAGRQTVVGAYSGFKQGRKHHRPEVARGVVQPFQHDYSLQFEHPVLVAEAAARAGLEVGGFAINGEAIAPRMHAIWSSCSPLFK